MPCRYFSKDILQLLVILVPMTHFLYHHFHTPIMPQFYGSKILLVELSNIAYIFGICNLSYHLK